MDSEISLQKLWVNGEWQGGRERQVTNPFNGKVVSRVVDADSRQMEIALEAAATSFEIFRKTSRYLRSRLLGVMANGISENRQRFIKSIVSESGKPFGAADLEVTRAITTFTIASEEAKRLGGDIIPLDGDASAQAYVPAISYLVGRGPVLGISPFNFPLNLVAHKVAPAIAVGVPIILKPAPQAPGAAFILAEIFEQSVKLISSEPNSNGQRKIPLSAYQVISCPVEVAESAVSDPRIGILSFTGSAKVGWHLQKVAVGKKVILELGGNAAVIIHEDANLPRAAQRCAIGGFTYAGQVCISVQRILVHEKIRDKFLNLFLSEIKKLKVGDPSEKETVIGPLIDSAAANRIESWIKEAVTGGAKILHGGTRVENVLSPFVLCQITSEMKIASEEAFGPVVTVDSYSDISEAIKKVNESKFGLQAGVFTDSAQAMAEAVEDLHVGGIMMNEIPSFRADNMPYGGMKGSGLGREGVKYAMEEYCERKTVVTFKDLS